jgi:hypothetical protein
MIPVVEELLNKVITDTMAVIKKNPDIINAVFQHINTPYGNKFKKFIVENDIKVILNFPRDGAVLPCYCIMLGEEMEESEALGEYLETDDVERETTGNFKVEYDSDTKEHYIDTQIIPIIGVTELYNETTDRDINNYTVSQTNPSRIILSETDASQNDSIQATILHLYTDMASFGTLMGMSYRIECWSDNADLTVYMYHLLKFIMLYKRQLLIENGILKPTIRGTDLEPVPDYFPTFVFRRSLILSGQIEDSYDMDGIENMMLEIDEVDIIQHLYSDPNPIVVEEKEEVKNGE